MVTPLAARRSPGPEAVFEAERARLTGLAYRMLGTLTDAEDTVQDAWLRWSRTDHGTVDNPAAWLTTTVGRLALDRLRARRRERTTYVGPWLPEPVVLAVARSDAPGEAPVPAGPAASDGADPADPADHAVRTESLSLGFLHVLERLSPRERVAFVLTEVFGEPHERAGAVVGANAAGCRQLVHRARRKLAGERPPDRVPAARLRPVVDAFVAACATGDVDGLLRLLAPDVVLVSDGGAERHAARRPVVGPDRVARLLLFVTRRLGSDVAVTVRDVNGAPAVVVTWAERPVVCVALEAGPAGIERLRLVVAPTKLGRLDRPVAVG